LSENELENKSWLYSALIVTVLAFAVFFVQHFVIQLFDPTVEIMIFYVPAAAIILVYVWRRFKSAH